NTFDVICGKGILHHLNLAPAFAEIVRVLKPDGRAVFIEPLGLNPAINWFRNRTPDLRTEDERPMRPSDFRLAQKHFGTCKLTHYHFTSLLAVPLRSTPLFKTAVACFESIDRLLFRMIPGLKWWAWKVIVKLEAPKK
ncbi:class I SAM-dependent methyltransferase, partial [bacterium]|nr:class I SAM-dependent methyltransferase [bacterium]